jgi:CRISPR/Cas system endoribonuclease Cas6 (RAMP superfamily)
MSSNYSPSDAMESARAAGLGAKNSQGFGMIEKAVNAGATSSVSPDAY